MSVEAWAVVVSSGMAVLSGVGALIAWGRANLSRHAREASELAESRAVAQVQAAQEQAVAARGSAEAAGEQLERLERLVAAQEAQGADLSRIAEQLSPVGLTAELVGGERYVLRNNGPDALTVVRVLEPAGRVMLKLPAFVEPGRAIDFYIPLSLAHSAPPVDFVLEVEEIESAVVVPIERS